MVQGFFMTRKGTVANNVLIPNTALGGFHPHPVDFLVPTATPAFASVILHGGTGTKEQVAGQFLLAFPASTITASNVNWALLNYWRSIVVLPQGQARPDTISLATPNGLPTWSSHDMDSGVDDVQFLKDLSTYITNTYGAIGRLLFGHSEGGIMAHRMWYEWSISYSHYMCYSATPSDYYITNPTLPISKKPILMVAGRLDPNLAIYGGVAGPGDHFLDQKYIKIASNLTIADVAYPALNRRIGHWYHFNTIVAALGEAPVDYVTDGVTTAVAIGTKTAWASPSGKAALVSLSAAGHGMDELQHCLGAPLYNYGVVFALSN